MSPGERGSGLLGDVVSWQASGAILVSNVLQGVLLLSAYSSSPQAKEHAGKGICHTVPILLWQHIYPLWDIPDLLILFRHKDRRIMRIIYEDNQPPTVMMYTNHCGETARRCFHPLRLYFGVREWHPEPQWFLDVWDVDKQADRTFALKDLRPL